jgi:RNA polymerase sigma factor (sigma-70 family)
MKQLSDESVLKWQPMVYGQARYFCRRAFTLSFEDLVQEGWIGVIEALETFDASFGCKLSGWVHQRVTSRMMDFHREHGRSWPVRISRRERVFPVSCALKETSSFPCPQPLANFRRVEAQADLEILFSAQPPRSLAILRALASGESKTSIARAQGLSASRVSQLVKQSFSEIREQLPG